MFWLARSVLMLSLWNWKWSLTHLITCYESWGKSSSPGKSKLGPRRNGFWIGPNTDIYYSSPLGCTIATYLFLIPKNWEFPKPTLSNNTYGIKNICTSTIQVLSSYCIQPESRLLLMCIPHGSETYCRMIH